MVEFPDIELIKKDVNTLLDKFLFFHKEYLEEKKTNKPEYTKKLRKVYNKINNEVDKLRLYNNEVEKNNREERNKIKGVENKPKQKVGRKKVLKGGDTNDNNLTSNQNNLTQNETDNTSNQDEFKPLPTPEIFLKNLNNNNENQNNINDTLAGVFDTEIKPQKGGRVKKVNETDTEKKKYSVMKK